MKEELQAIIKRNETDKEFIEHIFNYAIALEKTLSKKRQINPGK